jgi:hypothetical protein
MLQALTDDHGGLLTDAPRTAPQDGYLVTVCTEGDPNSLAWFGDDFWEGVRFLTARQDERIQQSAPPFLHPDRGECKMDLTSPNTVRGYIVGVKKGQPLF